MKKLLTKFAALYGFTFYSYRTYRSDMGVQCYEIEFQIPESKENPYKPTIKRFSDGYFPLEENNKKVFIQGFERFLKDLNIEIS